MKHHSALVLDVLIRYTQHLRDDGETHWGFLEWLTCLISNKQSPPNTV